MPDSESGPWESHPRRVLRQLHREVSLSLNRFIALSELMDISEWFGNARHLAFRDNPCGQEVRGAPSSGWSSRPRTGMYLMNVYLVVKEQVRVFCLSRGRARERDFYKQNSKIVEKIF